MYEDIFGDPLTLPNPTPNQAEQLKQNIRDAYRAASYEGKMGLDRKDQ